MTLKSKTLQEGGPRCEHEMEKSFSLGPNVLSGVWSKCSIPSKVKEEG